MLFFLNAVNAVNLQPYLLLLYSHNVYVLIFILDFMFFMFLPKYTNSIKML